MTWSCYQVSKTSAGTNLDWLKCRILGKKPKMLCMGVRTPDVALASHGLHETSWVRFTEPKGKVVPRAALFRGLCHSWLFAYWICQFGQVLPTCIRTSHSDVPFKSIQSNLLHVFHPTTTTEVFAIDLYSKGHETIRGSSKFYWTVKNWVLRIICKQVNHKRLRPSVFMNLALALGYVESSSLGTHGLHGIISYP